MTINWDINRIHLSTTIASTQTLLLRVCVLRNQHRQSLRSLRTPIIAGIIRLWSIFFKCRQYILHWFVALKRGARTYAPYCTIYYFFRQAALWQTRLIKHVKFKFRSTPGRPFWRAYLVPVAVHRSDLIEHEHSSHRYS